MYIAPSYENCPVCGSRIPCGEINDRSEWCRCDYYCSTCDHTFQKRVTVEIQEEWEGLPTTEPHYEKGQPAHFTWNGGKERGRVWERHLRDGVFHYHIDCPSVMSGERPNIEHEFIENELAPA